MAYHAQTGVLLGGRVVFPCGGEAFGGKEVEDGDNARLVVYLGDAVKIAWHLEGQLVVVDGIVHLEVSIGVGEETAQNQVYWVEGTGHLPEICLTVVGIGLLLVVFQDDEELVVRSEYLQEVHQAGETAVGEDQPCLEVVLQVASR